MSTRLKGTQLLGLASKPPRGRGLERNVKATVERPAKTPARAPGTAKAPHEVRIIGGQWRRSRLPVPDSPGLRPTPDRVRETLFNWLGQDLSGWNVLDVFAGTGALGFEAASRGAAAVTLVESDTRLARGLEAVRVRLGATAATVVASDGITFMKRAPARYDLVLLDPPFDAGLFEAALAAAAHAVLPQGWVYLEAPLEFDDAALAALGFEKFRHLRAGAVHAHLLRRT
jgi:16S rRNA (guanine(966)-N(2))-methyltransferase RsmD